MELALYHPRHGYYTTLRGFGPRGDFVTSPELHPAFGALLGQQALDLWEALDRPRPLRIVEVGGGSGALAESLLDVVQEHTSVEYALIERSPSLVRAQRERLIGYPVAWTDAPEPGHLVLANEVLDALPVHRVAVRSGRLRELRVGLGADGDFVWVETEPVPGAVQAYFDALGLLPPEGGVAEVNVDLPNWGARLAGLLGQGLLLVLDYGAPADELFGRPQGTLLTYYRHTLGSDPLVRLGRQDISAQVDFSTLARAAQAAGLRVLGLTTQARLLLNLGLPQLRARLPKESDQRPLLQLVDPRGLGRVRALFAAGGLPGWLPAGLAGSRPWPGSARPPALDARPSEADAAFLEQWREAFGDAEPSI
jgi:SAM-dependent MidA family methyltransferase